MKINELAGGGVTQVQLDALEKVLDQVFSKVGIDVEFTRHFIDRVNDARNVTPITIKELAMLFKKEFVKYGKPIAQLGPDAQAVMKDLESDINIPFALNWNGNELELVAKTVMRKKDFKSSNKEFTVERQLAEDIGAIPPLAELIVMAVVAQTTVSVLITAFKVALKTGKGLNKIRNVAKKAGVALDAKINPDMYNEVTESTKEELLSKMRNDREKRFYAAALDALDKLVQQGGTRQSVGGYAFDIARAFSGIDAKELESAYSALHESAGVGRIVKGVNTTIDVGPNEIIKQVKKYGNAVDRDGKPTKHLR